MSDFFDKWGPLLVVIWVLLFLIGGPVLLVCVGDSHDQRTKEQRIMDDRDVYRCRVLCGDAGVQTFGAWGDCTCFRGKS